MLQKSTKSNKSKKYQNFYNLVIKKLSVALWDPSFAQLINIVVMETNLFSDRTVLEWYNMKPLPTALGTAAEMRYSPSSWKSKWTSRWHQIKNDVFWSWAPAMESRLCINLLHLAIQAKEESV